MLEGVRVRELQRLAPDVLAGVLPRLYPQMLEIAYEHQDAGRPIFICTAASQEMAELMAIVLDVRRRGRLASRRSSTAHYTGRAGGPFTYREGKAEAIRELAEREGIDLAASWAYSDSESDLPMLRLVGHPVAVNPDAELGRVARARGLGGAALRAPRPAAARRRRARRSPPRSAGSARSCSRAAPRPRAGARTSSRCCAGEPARARRRAARDPRPRGALRRRADRAARRRLGPRAHVPARAVRASSASSG